VLKTFDQDARTFSIEYWTVDDKGPLRLDRSEAGEGLGDVAPKGSEADEFTTSELNLEGEMLEVPVRRPDDLTQIGTAEMAFTVRGDKLVARSKRWVPIPRAE
jgi:hypothetical protein